MVRCFFTTLNKPDVFQSLRLILLYEVKLLCKYLIMTSKYSRSSETGSKRRLNSPQAVN